MNKGEPTIFFICNDAERGLGLENILANYHIVCIDDNPIVDNIKEAGGNIFSLERQIGQVNPIFRNSNKLLQEESVQKYISDNTPQGENPNVIFFKIAPNLERTCELLGYKILNTTSELNRRFELKLSQYELLKDSNVHFPKTRIAILGETSYSELASELGFEFVIQYDRGHTGTGTSFIETEEDFLKHQNAFPKRTARVSRKIDGEAWTLNACATRFGTLYGGLSYQITGVPECTNKLGGTVGNDWKVAEVLSAEVINQILEITENVGDRISQDGFKGLFGLDFVIDKRNEVFLIEVNARQPASTGMHTKLMLRNKQIPLQLFHLAEFLFEDDLDYVDFINRNLDEHLQIESISTTFKQQNSIAIQPINAAQIIIRNTEDRKIKIMGDFKPGLYSFGGDRFYGCKEKKEEKNLKRYSVGEFGSKLLIRFASGYSMDNVLSTEGFLILAVAKGHNVSPGMELARIQAPCGLVFADGKVRPWVIDVVSTIKSQLL